MLHLAADMRARSASFCITSTTNACSFSYSFSQGTVWYSMFKWRIVANLTSPVGYQVSSLGNHEFDDGVADLVSFLDATADAFATVACNVDLSGEPELRRRLKGHVVVPVPRLSDGGGGDGGGGRDVLVGVIGYVTPETKDLSSTGRVVFRDEVEALREEVAELRKKGVGVIVAVGHSGYKVDLRIAQEVRHGTAREGGNYANNVGNEQLCQAEKLYELFAAAAGASNKIKSKGQKNGKLPASQANLRQYEILLSFSRQQSEVRESLGNILCGRLFANVQETWKEAGGGGGEQSNAVRKERPAMDGRRRGRREGERLST